MKAILYPKPVSSRDKTQPQKLTNFKEWMLHVKDKPINYVKAKK